MTKKNNPMIKKNTPPRGLEAITIIIQYKDYCNTESAPEYLPCDDYQNNENQVYTLHRKNGNIVVLKSERLLRAFAFLQGKEHMPISKKQLSEALSLDSDQVKKVMHTLRSDKKLIHYEYDSKGDYNLIRVDDINRLEPKYNGVKHEY